MIKNQTNDLLKVDIADSGWSSEFEVDDYGMSIKVFRPNGELGAFTRFQPHDVAAIQQFLAEQTTRWDQGEI